MPDSLLLLVALPFAGSLVAALLPAHARNAAASWAVLVAGAALAQVVALFPAVQGGGVVQERLAWLPSAGLDFVVRVDGFAWLFALLVTGLGTLVAIYARYYMSPEDPVARFFAFFLAFMGAMLGVVLSGNLVQLVFFWELTSLFSCLLIGYWHHRRDARRGARLSLTASFLYPCHYSFPLSFLSAVFSLALAWNSSWYLNFGSPTNVPSSL